MLSAVVHGTSSGLSAVAAILLVVLACQVTSMPSPFVGISEPGHHFVLTSAAIFLAACVSSTVGFAFSAIAAAMVLHLVPNTVEAVQIMMVASIGIQSYSVVALRQTICWKTCLPFLIGGALS